MTRDVVEVTARIGDTVLAIAHVDGHYEGEGFVVDGFTLHRDGAAVAIEGELHARAGLVDYTIRRTPAPVRSVPRGELGDRRAVGYIGMSLAVHLAVWGFAGTADEPAKPKPVPAKRPRLVHVPRPAAATPSREPAATVEIQDSPDADQVGGGRPHEGEAGAAGTDSTKQRGHIRLQRVADFKLARAEAIAQARVAGILGTVAAKPDAFRALVGSADLTSGYDTTHVQAPLYGGVGEAHGNFGFAPARNLSGAGCSSWNCGIIGTGRYGTISNADGIGDHWGGAPLGAANITRGGRGARRDPMVRICPGPEPCVVDEDGTLDKAIIRRYIRRELPKIQYCYEKALLANPTIAGTLTVEFLIGTSGAVTSVAATGVDPAVSSCTGKVIEAIEFPRSAGSTHVTYPFNIRFAGG